MTRGDGPRASRVAVVTRQDSCGVSMTSHDSCGVSACSSSARPTVRVPRSIASRRGRVDDERRSGGPRAVTRETRVESCGARVRTRW